MASFNPHSTLIQPTGEHVMADLANSAGGGKAAKAAKAAKAKPQLLAPRCGLCPVRRPAMAYKRTTTDEWCHVVQVLDATRLNTNPHSKPHAGCK